MNRWWLACVALTACVGSGPRESAPPPRGKPMAEYLAGPQKPAAPVGSPHEGDVMRIHLIDIGQGAATLVEFSCGAILIDTGGEQNAKFDSIPVLTHYLDDFFARRRDLDRTLALLVITHPHIDHTRGIATVLEHYKVKNVIDNGDVREDVGGRPQLALHAWLARHKKVGHLDIAASDVPVEGLTSPVIDPIGTCEGATVDPVVRALWGGEYGREETGHDPNNDSVVVRIDFGKTSALFAGDIETLAIARLLAKFKAAPEMLDVDVYQVPHHGSRNSTAAALIKEVTPKIALITAGPYARELDERPEFTAHGFGHPNAISLADLENPEWGVSEKRKPVEAWVGIKGAWRDKPSVFSQQTIDKAIYATSWDGTVVVTAWESGTLEVATER